MKKPVDPRIPFGVWNDDLMCYLKAVIPIDSDKVLFYFPADNCCDMRGAIKLATTVLPKVRWVETWAGNKLDSSYRKGLDNKWKFLDQRQPANVNDAGKSPAKMGSH